MLKVWFYLSCKRNVYDKNPKSCQQPNCWARGHDVVYGVEGEDLPRPDVNCINILRTAFTCADPKDE